MANTLSYADVLIRWKQEGLQSVTDGAKKANQAMASLGESAKKAGAILSVGLTAPLVVLGKQAIDAASDLNESMTAVESVFGKTADQVVRFSQTAATKLGLSKNATLSAASAMGALLKGVGLNQTQMATFSTQLIQTAADLGSFFNEDASAMLDRLRAGLTGESEPLKRFGILLTEAKVAAEAVRLGLADTTDEVSEAAKVQARYSLIMSDSSFAAGNFAATSKDLANSTKILQSSLTNLAAELGRVLLPYALQATHMATDLTTRFSGLSEEGKRMAVTIGAIAAAAGPALIVFGQVLSVVSKVGPAISLLTGPIGIVAAAIAALYLAWKTNFGGIQDLVKGLLDVVGPVVNRMVEFFHAAKERGLIPFKLALRTLIVGLKSQLGRDNPIVDFLREVLHFGNQIGKAFQNRDFGAFVDAITRAGRRLKNWFGEQLGDAQEFGGNLLKDLLKGVRGVDWASVGTTIKTGLGKFASWAGDLLGSAANFGGDLFAAIIEGIRAINWDVVGAAVQLLLQPGLAALKDLATWALDQIRSGDWDAVKRTLGDLALLAVEAFNTVADNTLQALKEFGGWVLAQLQAVDWTAVTEWMKTAGGNIIGWMLDGFGDGMRGVQNWITGGANESGGTSQGLGERLWTLISGAFAAVKDQLVEAGKAPFTWLWDGMKQKWDEIIAWISGLTLPALPGSAGPGTGGSGADSRGAGGGGGGFGEPPITNGALGGPKGGLTWVGEAGPELVRLPPGSMITPARASYAKWKDLFPGMALGGVAGTGYINWWNDLSKQERQRRLDRGVSKTLPPGYQYAEDGTIVGPGFNGGGGHGGGRTDGGGDPDWSTWLHSLNNRQRQMVQLARQQGNLNDKIRDGLMSGKYVIAEDGSIVKSGGYYGGGGGGGHDRPDREPRDRPERTPKPSREETDRNRDRTRNASDSMASGGGRDRYDDPTKGGKYMTFEQYKDYRKQIRTENRENEIPPMNFYGPVHLYPATAEIGMEIANYMLGASR